MAAIFEKKQYFQLTAFRANGLRAYVPMFHPHGELCYVVDGAITITVEGHAHTLHAGELAVLFPYLTHAYEQALDAKMIILLFDPGATAFDNTLLTQKPICFHTDGKAFYPLIDRAVTMANSGKTKTALAYLNAIIGELLEILPPEASDSASNDIITQILSYCAEHFTEDISIQQVANALYISQSYVSKIFSQKLHYSFREYINALRIHKAQNLLKSSNKKILQIMGECGFQNQSSFNRIFREICGVSPKQYRKE